MLVRDASQTDHAPARAERLLVCALVTTGRPERAADIEAAETREILGAALTALSDRVMWLDAAGMRGAASATLGALLDLGRCLEPEALAICAQLIARLGRDLGDARAVRAGAGPTQTLARLAALLAAPGTARALSLAWLAAHARDLAIDLLATLEPGAITPEVLTRLRRYGLTTWGHLARLDARDPRALRRQFGPAGALLATLVRGGDPRPFTPATEPERVRARRRFTPEATPDQALAALPALAAGLARRLAARGGAGKQGLDLRLRVVWESGATTRARRRLARPLAQPDELAQAARALFIRLLSAGDERRAAGAITSLTLALGGLTPRLPARPQPLFTTVRAPDTPDTSDTALMVARRERAARLARIAAEVGEPLARRYGAPALYRLEPTQPDAILPEERAQLTPLGAPAHERAEPDATPRAHASRAMSRLAGVADANGVPPPQPHWW